jgi:hypothetical protein
MPLPIMVSRIARLHACLDGARVVALAAQSQRKTILHHALDLPQALQSHVWRPQ